MSLFKGFTTILFLIASSVLAVQPDAAPRNKILFKCRPLKSVEGAPFVILRDQSFRKDSGQLQALLQGEVYRKQGRVYRPWFRYEVRELPQPAPLAGQAGPVTGAPTVYRGCGEGDCVEIALNYSVGPDEFGGIAADVKAFPEPRPESPWLSEKLTCQAL